jgi:hypothetical protein
MPKPLTLSERLRRASVAVEAARKHSAGPMLSREELRAAVRHLADALEEVVCTLRVVQSKQEDEERRARYESMRAQDSLPFPSPKGRPD